MNTITLARINQASKKAVSFFVLVSFWTSLVSGNLAFAQEMTAQKSVMLPEQSIGSVPQPEKPPVEKPSVTALQNTDRPLSVPTVEKKENPKTEVRDQEECSFSEAVDHLQEDVATAVIVKKISADDLKQLVNLKIEVGIAVLHGKIVLFTSGNDDEIRMLPAAKELLKDASLIAHTHPKNYANQPSMDDFLLAGTMTEYVSGVEGVYAYNHDGLIQPQALSYGYLVGKIDSKKNSGASTKATRDDLNQFIKSMDEYNSLKDESVLFRSAVIPTTFPGQPTVSVSATLGYGTVDQYSSNSLIRFNYDISQPGSSAKASMNFAAPQNLTGFSQFDFEMRMPTFNCTSTPCAEIEFVDSLNRTAALSVSALDLNFRQVTVYQYQLASKNPALDLTKIKQINFIVRSTFQVTALANMEIKTGGLSGAVPLSPEGYPIVSIDATPKANTLLPANPVATSGALNGGTINQSQSSETGLTFSYTLPTTSSSAYSAISFPAPQNLGTSFVITATTYPSGRQLKLQVIDATGKIANFYLNQSYLNSSTINLTGAALPAGFDTTKISQIKFVLDQQHMGSSGSVTIGTRGLNYLPVVTGSSYNAAQVITLPSSPLLGTKTTGTGTMTQTQTSPRNFNFNYNLPAGGDSVTSEIAWGQFVSGHFVGRPAVCGPEILPFVFAISGPSGTKLRAEIVDVNGKIADYLITLTGTKLNYALPTGSALPVGFDLSQVAMIRFVADQANMGISGTVNIEVAGLYISPSMALTPTNLVPLPSNGNLDNNNQYFPLPVSIAPGGALATVSSMERGGFIYYETRTAGWAGLGFAYDNYQTTAVETGNINGLSNLNFGISRGNTTYGFASKVKMEVVDSQNRKASVYLDGISDAEKVWSIPTSYFRNAGVDLTQVKVIYFIVEGQNQIGALNINHLPPGSSAMNTFYTTATITTLPGNPIKNHVAPPGADSGGAGTPRGMILNYTTGTPGWAGGGYSYDNFDTPAIETGNISQLKNLVFGLKGTAPQLKFEVLDVNGKKTSIYVRNLRPDQEQVWIVSTQDIASYGVDLTKVRWMYFIVEGQNQTGTVEINRVPTPLSPVVGGGITPLPGTPRNMRVAPAGVVANVSAIPRGVRLDYNTLTPGWAGTGFGFDDPQTTAVESANLSGLGNGYSLGFGLKGNTADVKLEVMDASGRKASVQLTGIRSDIEQSWVIPSVIFSNYGIDLTHITNIFFIVEGQNKSGALEIYRL